MTEQHTEINTPKLVVEKPVAGSIDHLAISKSLGYQIFRKDRRNAWTAEEDKRLRELLIEQYLKTHKEEKYNNQQIDPKEIDWFLVSSKMQSCRKAKECKKRWASSLDPHIKKGKWTAEEDELLIKGFKKYGTSWQKIAMEIEGRNEDQCSKRYTEVLNSDTKERLKPWTLDEDLTLIAKVKEYGTKWRKVSSSLPNRPSLTCRNRWRKIMTDIAKDTASDEIKKAIGVLDENGKPIVKFQNTDDQKSKTQQESTIQQGESDQNQRKNHNVSAKRNTPDSYSFDNHESKKHNREDDMTTSIDTNTPNSSGNQGSSSSKYKRQFKETDKHNSFTSPSGYSRMTTPSRTQTDWSFSLVDPRTNEELKSYSGNINSQELAHYLIELARFNGVTLTVHQHIHHHYSSNSGENVDLDPQSNLSRFGHFNYLPPLVEVPKLTSSSSPDNTADSNNSMKNYPESSLLRLLNSEENKSTKKDGSKTDYKPHRQQLHPSNKTAKNQTAESNGPSTTYQTTMNVSSKKQNEELEEELDFWETMRSINYPKTSKPVSQHHPLHYHQPSNYKEQLPYQPSDSFGIQRFPNMATPLVTNILDQDSKNEKSVQTNITNVNTDTSYGNVYMPSQNDDRDEEDEDELDIANQYGMYYNVFANKTQGIYGNYSKPNGSNNGSISSTSAPTGLINSGYLMPFNPS
ncbi:hypothetical protein CANINC_004216 [Pichia inconspicua]|uniref:Bas1p n=1 Tax=Pichia inconspicua TaxID=52247 RepID=A0A4T0WWK2_9ASCO|nr:hypothetical protein CANINC_004216 [[Candida] inconspicua]